MRDILSKKNKKKKKITYNNEYYVKSKRLAF